MNSNLGWLWLPAMLLAGCGDDDPVDVMGRPDSGMGDTSVTPPDTSTPTPDTSMPPPDSTTPGPDGSMPGDGGGTPDDTGVPGETIVVNADITTDTTWTRNNTYQLAREIYVLNSGGGTTTLTIESGTRIIGAARGTKNALIITTTGRIDAQGTATAPIVFTSSEASPMPQDFGGVVLLGRGPINVPGGTNVVEGLDPMESRGQYGGGMAPDAAHNCGTMRYVRIEYAGFLFGMDNELNGLTVAGCGTGTTLEYIHVHRGFDDGVEFFGGTANLKYAIVTSTGDDSLDWDEGWSGNVQFFIAQQSSGNGDSGIEADNLEDNHMAMPRSNPTIWNATFIGASDAAEVGAGVRFRRGTGAHLHNAIIHGFQHSCVRVGDAKTLAGLTTMPPRVEVRNSIFSECGEAEPRTAYYNGAGVEAQFSMMAYGNRAGMNPMLTDPANATAPNFVPMAGSPALSGGGTPSGAFFDATATYVGAVAGSGAPWYAGWTAFP